MPIQLWHFTLPENVASIREHGFRAGDLGYVYFTTPPDRYHEAVGEVLLEVTLSLTAEELKPHASPIVDDQVWDAEAQAHVTTTDPARIYRRVDYRIPAQLVTQLVNDHIIAIRIVPPEEYQRGRAEN
jgi:hypothetical protein